MPGSGRKFSDIASASDREQLQDTLAEIKYAVIFAELGFQVEIEPFGKRKDSNNPDLQISRDGLSTVVEVKRFRPARSGLKALDINELEQLDGLPTYGDSPRDWQKIFDEIERKFKQAGDDGIVAIWNNNDTLEPEEVESVTRAHRMRSNQHLSFVLFKPDVRERFSCFKLRSRLGSQYEQLITELEQLTAEDILLRPYLRRCNSMQNAG
jgi:hypothetical protein